MKDYLLAIWKKKRRVPDVRRHGVIDAPLNCRLTALNRDTPHIS